jgi:hypothetical protein
VGLGLAAAQAAGAQEEGTENEEERGEGVEEPVLHGWPSAGNVIVGRCPTQETAQRRSRGRVARPGGASPAAPACSPMAYAIANPIFVGGGGMRRKEKIL